MFTGPKRQVCPKIFLAAVDFPIKETPKDPKMPKK